MQRTAVKTGVNSSNLDKTADIILQIKFAIESHGIIVGNIPFEEYPEKIAEVAALYYEPEPEPEPEE